MKSLPTTARSRAILLLVFCGFLIVAAIAAATALIITDLHRRALADRERELGNIALVLSDEMDRTFQVLDLVHTSLIERIQALGITSTEQFDQQMSSHELHLVLREKIQDLPNVDGMALFDANGTLVNFARSWPTPALSISEREHFKELKSDATLDSIVSRPFQNQIIGTWSIILARKFLGPNGEFLGLLATEMPLHFFENFFRSIKLGPGSVISLHRRDGVRLVRYPHRDDPGRSYGRGALFTQVLAHADFGVTRLRGMDDGEERLVAGRSVAHYPLVVALGTTVSSALAGWRIQASYLTGAAILLSLLVGGAVLLSTRQLRIYELRMKADAERDQKLVLDTALNNMSQGLCMFDSGGHLVLCNERYMQMYGLAQEAIKPGATLRALIDYRKRTGSFAGDPEQYCSEVLTRVALEEPTSQSVDTADGRTIHVVTRPMTRGGWVATHEDITERCRLEKERDRLAQYDPLTDLSNRALFWEQLDRALACARRGERLAVLYIDLDHFKRVNDTLGHSTGDALLRSVAARLRACMREIDLIGRLGGDEFAVIQRSIETGSDAAALARRIRESLTAPHEIEGRKLLIDTSIGISIAPDDAIDRDQLLKNADLALYAAKAGGRGTYCFFQWEMDQRMKARQQLESDLRNALTGGEFELRHQPIINLLNNRVSGCEALLRWRHPERGIIEPAEFLPVAEDTGVIIPIGDWVLRQACRDAAGWPSDKKVAVNISAAQLSSAKFVATIAGALAESGLPAGRLELEITETVLMQDRGTILPTLRQLHDLGVRIAMDDFGIGYSSLSYLRTFPFDNIKIDRSFIECLSADNDCVAIVQAVTNLAQRLKMTTTAEGIETEQQRQKVRELGCTEMQGYLFSPPRPVHEINRLFLSAVEPTASAA